MSTERVIVHESLVEEFETELIEAVKGIKDRKFDLIRPSAGKELKQVIDGAIEAVSFLYLINSPRLMGRARA